MPSWFVNLTAPPTLQAAAERVGRRLGERAATSRSMLLAADARGVAQRLSRALRSGTYVPTPARLHWAMLDKRRELYSLELGDAILHDAFAALLTATLEPHHSDRLYSYRTGRSSWMALAALHDYAANHRRTHRDPKARGLYVVRGDIRSYGESIPMTPSSPIWAELRARLPGGSDQEWRVVENIVRPTIIRPDHDEASTLRGVPTGSPVATAIANLYLMPLDRLLEATGCHSSRFGDDILIVADNAEAVKAAYAETVNHLDQRGLQISEAKLKRYFWNGAARPPNDPQHRDFLGAASFVYLGCRLNWNGTLALPRAKLRLALSDVRQRLRVAARATRTLTPPARLELLCGIARETLSTSSPMATHYAPWLRRLISDREQLQQLDYLIALQIAELVSGRAGPRAFRDVSYRSLREQHRLPSLVTLRNRGERDS